MKIFISVVCHCHEELILKLDCLSQLAKKDNITVILKNNTALTSYNLADYCKKYDIHFIDERHGLGFGENNNFIIDYAIDRLNLTEEDYFLVLNPDVYITPNAIFNAVQSAQKAKSELVTINLFKDNKLEVFDNCVRKFPSVLDFISSYAGLGNKTIIDKSKVEKSVKADWAAGSFLLFKASLYKKLGGFDPNYFMYCEDIDICWRSQKIYNQKLMFFPQIKAIHHAQHANRSLFSKHFIWHVKSMFRYLAMFYGLRKAYRG
jgi:N-acetylglucosaminyl-diphospho-decaprenol L-rhamnosyltransferase